MGDESQSCLLGACLLMTYVPWSAKSIVITPCTATVSSAVVLQDGAGMRCMCTTLASLYSSSASVRLLSSIKGSSLFMSSAKVRSLILWYSCSDSSLLEGGRASAVMERPSWPDVTELGQQPVACREKCSCISFRGKVTGSVSLCELLKPPASPGCAVDL